MTREILYDVLCKKCNTSWTCSCISDENPATVRETTQKFHDSDNCVNCGAEGYMEILSIEDPNSIH